MNTEEISRLVSFIRILHEIKVSLTLKEKNHV